MTDWLTDSAFRRYVKSKMVYKSSLPCLRDSSNQIVHNNAQKATLLNNYFVSVFSRDDAITHDWDIQVDEQLNYTADDLISPALVNHKLKHVKKI